MKKIDGIDKRMTELLSALNLSQSDMAKVLGVTRVAVSTWCRGVQSPSESNIREICRQFNVDYYWLTEGRFEMFLTEPISKSEMLKRDYDLSDEEAAYVFTFLQSDKVTRQSLILFNKQFINNLEKISQGE